MRKSVRAAGFHALGLIVTFAASGSAAASERAGATTLADQAVLVAPVYEPQPTYGAAPTVKTIRIEDFMPTANGVTWSQDFAGAGGRYLFQTSQGIDEWWASIDLPNGAVVDRVEMQACDTTTTGSLLFSIARVDAPGDGGLLYSPSGSTGMAATPGCAFFSIVPTPTITINNQNASYVVILQWVGNYTRAAKVAAFRVYYRLQVSPAPAVATFPNDVPITHPLFRFVEAVAASGLTGGCATGSFCPDAPLTRGQMAVFLSVALGLHFPN